MFAGNMQKIWQSLLVFILICPASASGAETQGTIRFGVFPYISPSKLVGFYTPLKNLLAETLGQPVTMVSAPDFSAFIDNTHRGAYDFILTAPHLARLAEMESGYQRIARTLREVQGVYLVRKDSGIERLEQLVDKKIMIAQRVSILFQMSEQQLRAKGLEDGKNFTILETRTHNNAMWAPLRGEADAAVTGARLFDRLDHEQKDELQVIAKTSVAPGLMLMAHSRVPTEQVVSVREAVLTFADSPTGKQYFTYTGSRGFALISDSVMLGLDPYIDIAISVD